MDKDLKIHKEYYLNVICYKNSVFKVWTIMILNPRGLARLWNLRLIGSCLPSLQGAALRPNAQDLGTPCGVTHITEHLELARTACSKPFRIFVFACHLCVTGILTSPHFKKNSLGLYLACLCIYWPQCSQSPAFTQSGSVSCFSSGVSLRIIWMDCFGGSMWFPDERKEVQLHSLSQDDHCFCMISIQHSTV